MGDRNHLHVCRDCGNVMATSSGIGPRKCNDCGDDNFSLFLVLPELIAEPVEGMSVVWRLYGEFANEAGLEETTVPIERVEGTNPTVRDAVHALIEQYPQLQELVLTDEDELRSNCVVVHNHRNVYTEPMRLNTEVRARDTLALFPRIA